MSGGVLDQPVSRIAAAAVAMLVAAGGAAWPQDAAKATAELKDKSGRSVGTVTLDQHPNGMVLHGEMTGLPPGWHAIHIHAVGKCEPDFTAAGGHFNPDQHKHGLGESGSHAGDLPNIWADGDGAANFEILFDGASLNGTGAPGLLDDDGSALVVHAGPDDYKTDPAGASGDRIACGVVTRS